MFFLADVLNKKITMVKPAEALPGRDQPIPTARTHFVTGRPLHPPFPDGMETVQFGMGCFWGAERLLWQQPGVHVTAAGYGGGYTRNPTYQETCTGLTGHAETVLVVYDPAVTTFEALLKVFFESHDPTQGMRQGNDVGTVYRSVIWCSTDDQRRTAEAVKAMYQAALTERGGGRITTEIGGWHEFYHAEDYHQQYLAKNPDGYCGLKGTGVSCPIPAPAA